MTRYRPVFFGDAPLYDSECNVDWCPVHSDQFGSPAASQPRSSLVDPPPGTVVNIAGEVRFEIDDERVLEAIRNQQHRVKYMRVELEGGQVIEVGERPTNEFIDEAESVII